MKSITILISIVFGSAVCADWTMYHGNAQRTGYVPVVGPTAPKLKWTVPLNGPVISSPVIGADGTIYIGFTLEQQLHPSFRFDAIRPDGTIKWTKRIKFIDVKFYTASSPAIGPNGDIYVGAPDNKLYALRPDGTVHWTYKAANPVIQSPVVAPDGTVYEGMDGKIVAFSPEGSVLWSQTLGVSIGLPGGPSLATDGTVYAVGATIDVGARLYAFLPNGTQKWVFDYWNPYFWPLGTPVVAPDGSILTATEGIYAVRSDGTLKWMVEPTFGLTNYAPLAVDPTGSIYYSAYVYVWKLTSFGATTWQKTITADGFSLGSSYSAILVDANKNLFMGLGSGKRWAIDVEKKVWALRGLTGATLGSFSLPEITGTSSPALGNDGTLYVGCVDGKLYALKP